MSEEILLWLDDLRPAPLGWVWVKTIKDAQEYLKQGNVAKASLDHDLGACWKCYEEINVESPEEWLVMSNYQSMPHCDHVGTGYGLVCWMEENNIWPHEKPTVHSANQFGREQMLVIINRKFP